MSADYLEFYKKIGLFEIATIKKYPDARSFERKTSYIAGASFRDAYADQLEQRHPFSQIEWGGDSFANFKLLKERPPLRLRSGDDGAIYFDKDAPIVVSDWGTFIDSFRQVRNNLVHGAKFFKDGGPGLRLDNRDHDLVSAALAFIGFLEAEGLIKDLH